MKIDFCDMLELVNSYCNQNFTDANLPNGLRLIINEMCISASGSNYSNVSSISEGDNMTATIQKWGNSQGIRIPKVVLEDLNMYEGEIVEIFTQNDTIVIKHAAKKRKTIQELFANYNGDYKPEIIDWGSPIGEEIW